MFYFFHVCGHIYTNKIKIKNNESKNLFEERHLPNLLIMHYGNGYGKK